MRGWDMDDCLMLSPTLADNQIFWEWVGTLLLKLWGHQAFYMLEQGGASPKPLLERVSRSLDVRLYYTIWFESSMYYCSWIVEEDKLLWIVVCLRNRYIVCSWVSCQCLDAPCWVDRKTLKTTRSFFTFDGLQPTLKARPEIRRNHCELLWSGGVWHSRSFTGRGGAVEKQVADASPPIILRCLCR